MPSRHGTIAHISDLGLWVEADSLPELFTSAATALAELMTRGSRAGQVQWLPLELAGADYPDLLVELLNEVVYRLDGEGLITVALELEELTPARLAGRLGVLARDPARHRAGEPVKAATYHQARVSPQGQGWRAEVVLDV